MSDTQFYVLITIIGTGLAGIGAAIRFSVGRMVKAIDSNSAAMIDNTKSNAILSTKIDSIAAFVHRRNESEVTPREIPRERSRPVRPKSQPSGDRDDE